MQGVIAGVRLRRYATQRANLRGIPPGQIPAQRQMCVIGGQRAPDRIVEQDFHTNVFTNAASFDEITRSAIHWAAKITAASLDILKELCRRKKSFSPHPSATSISSSTTWCRWS